jgi:hypothetical protein
VGINGSSGSLHQVLAVGFARFGSEVYYVIDDSGFGPMNPYAALGGGPLARRHLLQ